MVQKVGDVRIKTCPCLRRRRSFVPDEEKTVAHDVTDVMKSTSVSVLVVPHGGEAMSLCHNHVIESLFDCEPEDELKMLIKYRENVSTSWHDEIYLMLNFERKRKILDCHVKNLVESPILIDDATKEIKEMIIRDSKLAVHLKPLVFERLVEILVEDNVNEFTKGSAACILGFANFDECDVCFKEKATEVLVTFMFDDRDTISIPVLRALTRLAYFSADYTSFIIENGALEGALAVIEPNFPSLKRIQNLAKFLVVVVVRRVQVPNDKVAAVVTILDAILKIRESPNLRCIVRACYTLQYIAADQWVNEGNILNNIIYFISHHNDMVSFSALRVAAYIVKSGNSSKTLNSSLQFLGLKKIWGKPKKFQKEVCHIISNMAAEGGISIKDLDMYSLMDALCKLLEVDDCDVRMEAACTIQNVIRCHRARMMIDVTVS
ncbi:uncharacterized protein LOC141668021 [Apium graveolens]|uniref:uncharacterized protein LOC141668021 n=1 Tax=Apium graveolens TaxID=4045 RepID=UPI003D798B41